MLHTCRLAVDTYFRTDFSALVLIWMCFPPVNSKPGRMDCRAAEKLLVFMDNSDNVIFLLDL